MKIAPSMLASKPENYVKDAQILEKANVEWFHIDMLLTCDVRQNV